MIFFTSKCVWNMGWSSGTSQIYAVVVMPLSPLGPAQSLTAAIIRGLTTMRIALLVALRLGLLAYATMQLRAASRS